MMAITQTSTSADSKKKIEAHTKCGFVSAGGLDTNVTCDRSLTPEVTVKQLVKAASDREARLPVRYEVRDNVNELQIYRSHCSLAAIGHIVKMPIY